MSVSAPTELEMIAWLDHAGDLIRQQKADNERLRAAVEQALDDMGEQGLSVCQQAKEMLQAALKDTTP